MISENPQRETKARRLQLVHIKLLANRQKLVKTTLFSVGFLLILFIFYLIYNRLFATVGGNSDGASNLLEAKSMLKGNLLLKGWTLSPDTFWTIDTSISAIVIAVRGFTPSLLYNVPAVIYALIMMASLFLIKGKSNLAKSWPMIVVGLVIIGITSPLLTKFAAESPIHLGTVLYCLFTLIVMDKIKEGWTRNIAIFVIGILACIGDPFTLFIFILPMLVVLGLRWYYIERNKNDLFLIGTLIAVIPATILILKAVRLFGGFYSYPLDAGFMSYASISSNISLSIQSILYLFGVNPFGYQLLSYQVIESFLRLVSLCLVIYFAVKSIQGITRKNQDYDIISGILCMAILFDIISFILGQGGKDLGSPRFLSPVIIFGGIIAGRNIKIQQRWFSLAAILFLACYLVFFIPRLLAPTAIPPTVDVENWLRTNGYTYGYGAYWDASIITVDTSNDIKVRPVSYDGYICPWEWLSENEWYDNTPAYFLVYDNSNSCPVNFNEATKTFGPPSQIKQIDNFTILTWKNDITPELHK
jgi:hypothetical protein